MLTRQEFRSGKQSTKRNPLIERPSTTLTTSRVATRQSGDKVETLDFILLGDVECRRTNVVRVDVDVWTGPDVVSPVYVTSQNILEV